MDDQEFTCNLGHPRYTRSQWRDIADCLSAEHCDLAAQMRAEAKKRPLWERVTIAMTDEEAEIVLEWAEVIGI